MAEATDDLALSAPGYTPAQQVSYNQADFDKALQEALRRLQASGQIPADTVARPEPTPGEKATRALKNKGLGLSHSEQLEEIYAVLAYLAAGGKVGA